MTVTFELPDLIQPVSRAEVERSIYDALAGVGVDTSAWKSGAVVRTMIAATAIVLAAMSELQARITRSGFLELAEGPWLTLTAHHVYGVDRIPATHAAGPCTLTNTGVGFYSLDPGDAIATKTADGRTYTNTLAFEIGPGETVTTPFRASEAGSSSSAAAGEINAFVTPIAGVSITNPTALTGTEAEADPVLRARCSERLGSLSPFGPWDAYTSALRAAKYPDGTSLGITRVRTLKDGYGNVSVYCATPSGAPTPDALVIGQEAIDRGATPVAVTGTVLAATPVAVTVTANVIAYEGGRPDAQLIAAASARVRALISAAPIGGNHLESPPAQTAPGYLFRDALITAIHDTALDEILSVQLATPAEHVALNPTDVAVPGAINLTVQRLPRDEPLTAA